MTKTLWGWAGLAWCAAVLPLCLDVSSKAVGAIWAFLLTVGMVLPPGRRAFRCAFLYLMFVSFAAVDFLGSPILHFVGGAPAGLAYYPADFWLVLSFAFALAEGTRFLPGFLLRSLILIGVAWATATVPSLLIADWPIAAVQQWLALLRALLASILIYSQSRDESSRVKLVGALLVGLLCQSIIAIAQHVRGDVLGLLWLGEAPAEFLRKAIAPGVVLWRSGGAMGHPNVLATFLLGLLPLSIGLAVRRQERSGVRVWAILTFSLACAALVWTYSRGAWVSLATVAALIFLVGLRRILESRIFIPITLLTAIVFGLMFPAISHRLLHTESSATLVRFELVPVALRMAARYPFHGVGLSHFARHIESFDPEMKLELFRHPVHNIVLLDFAEAGLLAGIVSCILWGAVGMAAAVNIRLGIAQQRPILTAVWSGCAAIVVHNMGDWTLRRPDILLLLWVLLALGSAAAADKTRVRHD